MPIQTIATTLPIKDEAPVIDLAFSRGNYERNNWKEIPVKQRLPFSSGEYIMSPKGWYKYEYRIVEAISDFMVLVLAKI